MLPVLAAGPLPRASELRNLGFREPLSSLKAEFRFNASFAAKVQELEQLGYRGWRRVRGDGNCFYRAMGFGLLEQMACAASSHRALWAIDLRRRLEASQPPEEDAQLEAFAELLDGLGRLGSTGNWSQDTVSASVAAAAPGEYMRGDAPMLQIHQLMRDPGNCLDLALVRALRRLAAEYLVANRDDENVMGGGISFETICTAQGYDGTEGFCRQVVLPEGTEAEGVVLKALPSALGVGLRIAFLDRLQATSELPFCEYTGAEMSPVVHMQLRPGHYDLLYLGEEPSEVASAAESIRGTTG